MKWLPNGTTQRQCCQHVNSKRGRRKASSLVYDLRETMGETVSQSSSSLDTFELGG